MYLRRYAFGSQQILNGTRKKQLTRCWKVWMMRLDLLSTLTITSDAVLATITRVPDSSDGIWTTMNRSPFQ